MSKKLQVDNPEHSKAVMLQFFVEIGDVVPFECDEQWFAGMKD